jgi:hypothetical protein
MAPIEDEFPTNMSKQTSPLNACLSMTLRMCEAARMFVRDQYYKTTFTVESCKPAFPANIRQGWKWMAVTNALTYLTQQYGRKKGLKYASLCQSMFLKKFVINGKAK